MNIELIKARLLRGATLSIGELKLVVSDLITLIARMEADIATLKQDLNAKPRGGRGGSKKSDSDSPVQP